MPRLFSAWKGLPSSLYTLLVVQVVHSSGSFVQPFLALLLSRSLGFDTAQTGLFLTINSLAMLPGSLWGGRLVDRWGRKRVLVASRVVAALCLFPCAFLDGHLGLAVLLVVVSVVSSFGFPAFPAMVTDLTPPERRQDAFSLLYLGHNLGFALGTTLAGFLFVSARPWLFWGETAMILVTVGLTLAFLPETKPQAHEEEAAQGREAAHEGGLASALRARPELLVFSGLIALIWLAYSQVWFGLPLWVEQVHGSTAGPPLYGALMAFTAVVVLVVTPLTTKAAHGRSPASVIALGAVLLGVGFVVFMGGAWVPALVMAGFVLTVGEVLWATGAPAYLSRHTPITHRGRFNAVLNALQNTGSMAGPWLGGIAAGLWGLISLWPLALAINLVAAAGLWALDRQERGGSHES